MDRIAVCALGARSSLSFVDHIFRLKAAGEVVAILPEGDAGSLLGGVDVTRVIEPGADWGWFSGKGTLDGGDGAAQISLTSGTTGRPSGILLTADAIADTSQRLIEATGLTADVREYVGIPATHSFGLGRFRAIAAVGGQAYLPEHGFDPVEFSRMLSAGQINALSAVPSLLRVLLARPEAIRSAGMQVKWLEIGSQALSLDEKLALKALFPECRIVQHYGLTEASRTTFLDISATEGPLLGSVGMPVGRTEIALDESGRVKIRGPHVARTRIDADGFHDLLDADGWLTTNDLGTLDEGHLFFGGRADDLINCGGLKLSPDMIEDGMAAVLGTRRGYAVARTPDAIRGEGVLVVLEEGSGLDLSDVRAAAVNVVEAMGVHAESAVRAIGIDALPVTETGKVRRGQLSAMDVSGPIESPDPAFEDSTMSPLAASIANVINRDHVGAEDSIAALQVDSLNYIQISLLLDQAVGPLPDDWETIPIGELERRGTARTKRVVAVETGTIIRALAILLVVLDHAWAYGTYGAAVPLMAVAGMNFARFQVPLALDGKVRDVLAPLAWRVVLPYFAVVTVDLLYHRVFSLVPYLLISNFGDGVVGASGNRLMSAYWFIETYILMVGFFGILLAIRPVASLARSRPWPFAITLLCGFLALAFIAVFNRAMPAFGQWTFLSVGWAFAFGWAIQKRTRPAHTVILIVLLCAVPLITNDNLLLSGRLVWAPLGNSALQLARVFIFYLTEMLPILLMLFVSRMEVPTRLAQLLSWVASVSLYIYIMHPFVLHVTGASTPSLPRAMLGVLASVVVGVMLGFAIDWIAARAAQRRVGQMA